MKKIHPIFLPKVEVIGTYARFAGLMLLALIYSFVLGMAADSSLRTLIWIFCCCVWCCYLQWVDRWSFLASRAIERRQLKAERARLEQVLAKKEAAFFYRDAPADYSHTKTRLAEVKASLARLDPSS